MGRGEKERETFLFPIQEVGVKTPRLLIFYIILA
jgi:hypothetical protein